MVCEGSTVVLNIDPDFINGGGADDLDGSETIVWSFAVAD